MTNAPGPILVSGAGGFIGSVVTRSLVEAGVPVRAMLGPPGAPVCAPPTESTGAGPRSPILSRSGRPWTT